MNVEFYQLLGTCKQNTTFGHFVILANADETDSSDIKLYPFAENSHLCVDNDANVFGDVSHVSDSHPPLGRVRRVLVPESQHRIRLGEMTIHEAGLQSESFDKKKQCNLIIDIPNFVLQFALIFVEK